MLEKKIMRLYKNGELVSINANFLFDRWAKNGIWQKIMAAARNPNTDAHFIAKQVTMIFNGEFVSPETLNANVVYNTLNRMLSVDLIDEVEFAQITAILDRIDC